MADTKWQPSVAFAKAIARIQEQAGTELLNNWTAAEATAVIRYMAEDAWDGAEKLLPVLQAKENGLAGLQKREPRKLTLRDAFKAAMRDAISEPAMVEQANMKKKLQAAGIVAAEAKKVAQYE